MNWAAYFFRVYEARGPEGVTEAACSAVRRWPDEWPFIEPAVRLLCAYARLQAFVRLA